MKHSFVKGTHTAYFSFSFCNVNLKPIEFIFLVPSEDRYIVLGLIWPFIFILCFSLLTRGHFFSKRINFFARERMFLNKKVIYMLYLAIPMMQVHLSLVCKQKHMLRMELHLYCLTYGIL